MARIRLITPHTNRRPTKLEEVRSLALPDENPAIVYDENEVVDRENTEIDKTPEFLNAVNTVTIDSLGIEFSNVGLPAGPGSIESEFDEMMAAPYVVQRAIEAEQDGVDAVMIDCMGDPGLDPAREAVNIPVMGPGETSLHLAAMLGHTFAFVTVLDRIRPMIEKRAAVYGVAEKMTRVRSVNVPVLSISEDHEALVNALYEQSLAAIDEDHADVIILGCTGFLGVAEELQTRLSVEKGCPVPVINPIKATVMTAFGLIKAGLSHSALSSPGPRDKGVTGYGVYPVSEKFIELT